MKVAIITCHRTHNYGAVLQAYALQHFLISRGHNVDIIDYYPSYVKWHDNRLRNLPKKIVKLPDKIKCQKVFGKFLKEKLILTNEIFETFDELKDAHLDYDVFITGSDQVWNMNMRNGMDDCYFLSFTSESAQRISYAASIAMDKLNEAQKQRFKEMLAQFSFISIREQSGVELLNEIDIPSRAVCDPVYLLEKTDWSVFEKSSDSKEKYVLIYAFYQQKEIYTNARKIAKEKGYKVYSVGASYFNAFMDVDKYFWGVSPERFVGLVHNAEIVLTNSFHGLSFALILNVPVFVFKTKTSGNSRIIDMLKKINVYTEDDSDLCAEVTDYSEIKSRIAEYRAQSIDFLKGCNL